MKKFLRSISYVLTVIMLLASLPTFAPNISAAVSSGQCGDEVFWSISDDKVLTISGSGPMNWNLGISPWDSLYYTTLVIEEGITSISYNAFAYSNYLETAYLPVSITEIDHSAFMKCPVFTDLYYAGNMNDWNNIFVGNSVFHDIVKIHFANGTQAGICGDNVFWSISDDKVLTVSGKGDMYMFKNSIPWERLEYTTLVIEEGVTNISYNAFAYSEYLETAYIPSSVTHIDDFAFTKCPAFTDLYYAGSRSDWDRISIGTSILHDIVTLHFADGTKARVYGNNIFWSLSDDKVLTVSGKGFMYGSEFPWAELDYTSLIIENGVTNISDNAFNCSEYLNSVYIPLSVTEIGDCAFANCPKLTKLHYEGNRSEWESIQMGMSSIDDSVKIRFDGEDDPNACGYDMTWTLDKNGVLTISGEGAMFDYDYYSVPAGSKRPAWADCRNDIKSVIIEDGVTSIGSYAFWGCYYITSVTMPDSVTKIGERAFSHCNVTSICIPSNVTDIGDYALANCVNLASVSMPDCLTRIGEAAFLGCYSLKSIEIPKNVEYIGDRAFEYCTALSDVYYAGTENRWNKINISDGNENLTDAEIHFFLFDGDINGDGVVNSKDSNMIKRIVCGMFAPNEAQLTVADMDFDGSVTTKDLYMIKKLMY